MSVQKLKNGLTTTQVEKAKALFKQVSLKQMCDNTGVKYTIITNVLRGESPHIEKLHKVLAETQIEIKRKAKLLKSLPL